MRFNCEKNWTYSEGCGCQVTFFHESDFRTSRMTPGEGCREHKGRRQEQARSELIQRAKDALRFARDCDEDGPNWRADGSALPTTGPADPGIGASPDEE